jgi:5-methyltetrahydrofolate--homocysteine methyltransferase
LFGKYPAILTDEVVGEQAKSVFKDAQEMLVILKEKKLTAKGIYGIFPANQVNDDDIELTDEKRNYKHLTLRQQSHKTKGQNCLVGLYCSKDSKRIIWVLLCNYRFWC